MLRNSMKNGRCTLWVLGALIGASACASSQVTPMGPVPAGVRVDLLESSYQIGGTTEDELLQQMNALGPGNNWFEYRWWIDWTYRYDEVEQPSIVPGGSGGTVCETKDIQLTLRFSRTVPQWEPPDAAPEELILRWEGFVRAVRIHGEGHRDIVVDATREIMRRLGDLETSNCAFMEREARRLFDDLLERSRELDREYDQTTQRGRTQGATWPFRGGALQEFTAARRLEAAQLLPVPAYRFGKAVEAARASGFEIADAAGISLHMASSPLP